MHFCARWFPLRECANFIFMTPGFWYLQHAEFQDFDGFGLVARKRPLNSTSICGKMLRRRGHTCEDEPSEHRIGRLESSFCCRDAGQRPTWEESRCLCSRTPACLSSKSAHRGVIMPNPRGENPELGGPLGQYLMCWPWIVPMKSATPQAK